MTRSEWFFSPEGLCDRASVRETLRQAAPRDFDEALVSDIAWLVYQQRVRIITQIERRFAAVTHEVLHGLERHTS